MMLGDELLDPDALVEEHHLLAVSPLDDLAQSWRDPRDLEISVRFGARLKESTLGAIPTLAVIPDGRRGLSLTGS
jgi:hypothetical protein